MGTVLELHMVEPVTPEDIDSDSTNDELMPINTN